MHVASLEGEIAVLRQGFQVESEELAQSIIQREALRIHNEELTRRNVDLIALYCQQQNELERWRRIAEQDDPPEDKAPDKIIRH